MGLFTCILIYIFPKPPTGVTALPVARPWVQLELCDRSACLPSSPALP